METDYEMFLSLEEENEQVRVFVGSPPRPHEEIQTIRVPRQVLLNEVVKRLGGVHITYNMHKRYGRYTSSAKAYIPNREDPSKFKEAIVYSTDPASSEDDAKERAAENLIASLCRKYNFEVDDINWNCKDRFARDMYERGKELLRLKEENQALKEKVGLLKEGWLQTVDDMDYVFSFVTKVRHPSADICLNGGPVNSVMWESVVADEEAINAFARAKAKLTSALDKGQ